MRSTVLRAGAELAVISINACTFRQIFPSFCGKSNKYQLHRENYSLCNIYTMPPELQRGNRVGKSKSKEIFHAPRPPQESSERPTSVLRVVSAAAWRWQHWTTIWHVSLHKIYFIRHIHYFKIHSLGKLSISLKERGMDALNKRDIPTALVSAHNPRWKRHLGTEDDVTEWAESWIRWRSFSLALSGRQKRRRDHFKESIWWFGDQMLFFCWVGRAYVLFVEIRADPLSRCGFLRRSVS